MGRLESDFWQTESEPQESTFLTKTSFKYITMQILVAIFKYLENRNPFLLLSIFTLLKCYFFFKVHFVVLDKKLRKVVI